jgi:hypothetical protein
MKLRMFIWAIALIAVHGVIGEACELPLIDPPPYTTLHSWSPGPRAEE